MIDLLTVALKWKLALVLVTASNGRNFLAVFSLLNQGRVGIRLEEFCHWLDIFVAKLYTREEHDLPLCT